MPEEPGGRYLIVAVLLASATAAGMLAGTSHGPASSAAPLVGHAGDESPLPIRAAPVATLDDLVHSFYFTRGIYSGTRRSWAIDAPQADRWIASVIRRLTLIDVSPAENYVALDDPDLRRFPFLYILEVGSMRLREAEVEGLRNYLLRGGFLMVDDFWGSWEWANWEQEISRVLPGHEMVEIPLSHPLFSTLYRIEEIVQVPSVGNARRGITHERDGYVPHVRGIFDDRGRLMVVINWNTDIGDAWEWAEAPYYPLQYSTYAYQVAANTFMYALTH
jgi:hypothetical protein